MQNLEVININLKPIFSKLGKMIVCSLLVFTLFVSNAAPSQASQLTINQIKAEAVSLGFRSTNGWLHCIEAIVRRVGVLGRGIPGTIDTVSNVILDVPVELGCIPIISPPLMYFPDQLYLTKDGGFRIWPADSQYQDLYPLKRDSKGQIVTSNALFPNLKVDFNSSAKINFWGYDLIGSDDDLGTINVTDSEAGQGVKSAVVSNPSEGNLYYVEYEVK